MVAPHSSEPLNGDRENIINHIVTMWFTQGGEAQFGMLGRPTNEDELVAAILSIVRSYIQAEHDGLRARVAFTENFEGLRLKLDDAKRDLESARAANHTLMERSVSRNSWWRG